MNEPKNFYIVIPAQVRYCLELKASEKLFYSDLLNQCNEQGYCVASNSYFSELLNVSRATISQYISSLQKAGFITCEIDNFNGNTRRIFFSNLHTRSKKK